MVVIVFRDSLPDFFWCQKSLTDRLQPDRYLKTWCARHAQRGNLSLVFSFFFFWVCTWVMTHASVLEQKTESVTTAEIDDGGCLKITGLHSIWPTFVILGQSKIDNCILKKLDIIFIFTCLMSYCKVTTKKKQFWFWLDKNHYLNCRPWLITFASFAQGHLCIFPPWCLKLWCFMAAEQIGIWTNLWLT